MLQIHMIMEGGLVADILHYKRSINSHKQKAYFLSCRCFRNSQNKGVKRKRKSVKTRFRDSIWGFNAIRKFSLIFCLLIFPTFLLSIYLSFSLHISFILFCRQVLTTSSNLTLSTLRKSDFFLISMY